MPEVIGVLLEHDKDFSMAFPYLDDDALLNDRENLKRVYDDS